MFKWTHTHTYSRYYHSYHSTCAPLMFFAWSNFDTPPFHYQIKLRMQERGCLECCSTSCWQEIEFFFTLPLPYFMSFLIPLYSSIIYWYRYIILYRYQKKKTFIQESCSYCLINKKHSCQMHLRWSKNFTSQSTDRKPTNGNHVPTTRTWCATAAGIAEGACL